MSVIPSNNLPIYLQNYTVGILCRDVDTVCPDSPLAGGCSGTRYGCCSDETTAKQDVNGTNCPRQCGTVLYSTVGLLPSNQKLKRVWNLDLTGTLQPNGNDEYVIIYNFSQVEYSEKDITFENILSGTIVVCGRVLDASKVADYGYCDTTSILKIYLKKEKLPRLKRETNFSMNLLLDDNVTQLCSPCSTQINTTNVPCRILLNTPLSALYPQSTASGWTGLDFTNPESYYYTSPLTSCDNISFGWLSCCTPSLEKSCFAQNYLLLNIFGPNSQSYTYTVDRWGSFTQLAVLVQADINQGCTNPATVSVTLNDISGNSQSLQFTYNSTMMCYLFNNTTDEYGVLSLPFS